MRLYTFNKLEQMYQNLLIKEHLFDIIYLLDSRQNK